MGQRKRGGLVLNNAIDDLLNVYAYWWASGAADPADRAREEESCRLAEEALRKQDARDEIDQFGAKRCPFCGGEADMKPEGDYHEMTCRDCGVAKQGRTYEQALAEWNYRRIK